MVWTHLTRFEAGAGAAGADTSCVLNSSATRLQPRAHTAKMSGLSPVKEQNHRLCEQHTGHGYEWGSREQAHLCVKVWGPHSSIG